MRRRHFIAGVGSAAGHVADQRAWQRMPLGCWDRHPDRRLGADSRGRLRVFLAALRLSAIDGQNVEVHSPGRRRSHTTVRVGPN